MKLTLEQKIQHIKVRGGIPPAMNPRPAKPEEPVDNPYLAEFLQYMRPGKWGWEERAEDITFDKDPITGKDIYSGPKWEAYMDASRKAHEARWNLVKEYAWAVPNEDALAAMSELGPIVEVGAGTAYWASLLRARGVNVQCFDTRKHLKVTFFAKQAYAPMAVGNEFRAMRLYPDRTLFLCWPPYSDPMAYNAARLTQAERMVYVGEVHGCTGDLSFMQLIGEGGNWWDDDEDKPPEIEPRWEREHEVDIPQWYGMHDYLQVFRRIR